jgi:hypothetical protein
VQQKPVKDVFLGRLISIYVLFLKVGHEVSIFAPFFFYTLERYIRKVMTEKRWRRRMQTLKTRLVLRHRDDNSLVLSLNPTRRLVFGIVSVVLLIAFFVAVDYERDFSADHFFSSLVYFALVSVCIILAGWENRKVFEQNDGGLVFERRVYLFMVSREFVSFDDIQEVVLSRVELSRADGEPTRSDRQRGTVPAQMLKRDIELYRLTVGTEQRRYRLEESSVREELEDVGRLVSQYMEVPFFSDGR